MTARFHFIDGSTVIFDDVTAQEIEGWFQLGRVRYQNNWYPISAVARIVTYA